MLWAQFANLFYINMLFDSCDLLHMIDVVVDNLSVQTMFVRYRCCVAKSLMLNRLRDFALFGMIPVNDKMSLISCDLVRSQTNCLCDKP